MYSVDIGEGMACAAGINIRASEKQCIQIAKVIRGKEVIKAKTFLNNVINMKEAVPMTRFNRDTGHKKKIGPGRYPVKACSAVLNIVENAEANARFKGLNASNLVIFYAATKKGSDDWHFGRKRRRKVKQCHFEIVLKETENKVEKAKATKETVDKKESNKKEQPTKQVIKPVEKQVAVKKEQPVTVQPKTEPVEKKETPIAVKPKQEVKPVEKKEIVKKEEPAPIKVEEKK